jgi:hypothetical protein
VKALVPRVFHCLQEDTLDRANQKGKWEELKRSVVGLLQYYANTLATNVL